MEQDLAPIVLAVLYWIDAEVDLCEQWKVLDMSELIDFADVVHADVHKLQTLDHFEPTESSNLVLWQVQGSENWKRVQVLDFGQIIGADEELFKPETIEVLKMLNGISVQRQDPQWFVIGNSIYFRNLVVIQVQVFQI